MTDSHTRRRFLQRVGTTALAAGSVAVAGCSGGGSSSADADIEMTSSAFDPDSLEVAVGDTVVWENTSSVEHTVTAYQDQLPDGGAYFASGDFDSEEAANNNAGEGYLESDDSYEHTFETAGEFSYYCIPHESTGMTATITVTDA